MAALAAADIRRLFTLLDEELGRSGAQGELFLVGGAVMCLAYATRPSTQDVDALFIPARQVREAAARVAMQAGIAPDWLNGGVKGFLSEHGEFSAFLELDHLRVMVAQPRIAFPRRPCTRWASCCPPLDQAVSGCSQSITSS